MNKKSPDKVNKVRKIRNMFVLRKGNSTRDSNLTRQNSNDNVYGLERQSSINSLNNSDSCYSRDNSIENQSYIRNQKQASSNGFTKSVFNPYSQGSTFKTPRQGVETKNGSKNSSEPKEADLQNCANNFNIANRNIKIRSIASVKGDWRTKSNGFKDIIENNNILCNINIKDEGNDAESSRFKPISSMGQK